MIFNFCGGGSDRLLRLQLTVLAKLICSFRASFVTDDFIVCSRSSAHFSKVARNGAWNAPSHLSAFHISLLLPKPSLMHCFIVNGRSQWLITSNLINEGRFARICIIFSLQCWIAPAEGIAGSEFLLRGRIREPGTSFFIIQLFHRISFSYISMSSEGLLSLFFLYVLKYSQEFKTEMCFSRAIARSWKDYSESSQQVFINFLVVPKSPTSSALLEPISSIMRNSCFKSLTKEVLTWKF